MKEQGLNIKYTFKPMKGGNGEFYIWKTVDSVKKIVFSNKKDLHPDAVAHSLGINLKNSEIIIKALQE